MKSIDATDNLHATRDLYIAEARNPETSAASGRDLLSLDGIWRLAFDPENRGKSDNWVGSFPGDAVPAVVPAVWEMVRPGYDGVGWYRRIFDLPTGWQGRTLRLRFHAAQYFAEVWLNGKKLGSHEGGFLSFEFTVSNQVLVGQNEVVVRVINPPMNHEIEGFRCGAPLNQGPIPIGKAGWYYNFGGLWQSVELQATDGVVLQRVVPEPSLADEQTVVKIEVERAGTAVDHEIVCEVIGMEGECASPLKTIRRRLKSGYNAISVKMPMPGARLWSLDDPYLHTLHVSVRRGGHVVDKREVRFGMREFTVREHRFELNGRRIMLKGFLQQGSWPRTLVRPESREIAERELRTVKDRGFNFIRAHMLPPLPEWLDLCDEIGLLVMNEPPIGWIERTERTEEICWREIKGLVERDAHHASIVCWCLMNEVFHLLGFTPKVVIDMTTGWMKRVQRMDPTRAIIDVSGGHGFLPTGGAGDMLPDTAKQGLTAMLALPGEPTPHPVLDAHIYREFPARDATVRHFRTMGRGDRLFFLTEYGAPPVPPLFDEVIAGYTPEDRDLGLEDYRLHADFADSLTRHFKHPAVRAAFADPREFIVACNRMSADTMFDLTLAMRSNANVAGYCFCQLADASGELFGALDVWRRPKPMMEALAEASAPGTLAIFANTRVAAPGTDIEVELMLPAGDVLSGKASRGEWTMALADENGRVRQRWSGTVRAGKSGAPVTLLKVTVKAPSTLGAWKVTASGNLGDVSLHGRMDLRVMPPRPKLRGTVAVNGVASPLARALAGIGLEIAPFGNNFREAELPVFMDLSKPSRSRQHWFEEIGQLRKVLQLGGCAVVFDPEMALMREVMPEAAIRMQPMMRPVGYTVPSPVFAGLSTGGLMDFTWAELGAVRHDSADDVHAIGGQVLAGGLTFNMWTRPAEFQHGASLYTLPVGKGTLVVCHHRLIAAGEDGHSTADLLLAGLVTFAAKANRVTDKTPLFSRCMDPLMSSTLAPRCEVDCLSAK